MNNYGDKNNQAGGVMFVGGMFIGAAVGFILVSTGVLDWLGLVGCVCGGLGFGFIMMGAVFGMDKISRNLKDSLKDSIAEISISARKDKK